MNKATAANNPKNKAVGRLALTNPAATAAHPIP